MKDDTWFTYFSLFKGFRVEVKSSQRCIKWMLSARVENSIHGAVIRREPWSLVFQCFYDTNHHFSVHACDDHCLLKLFIPSKPPKAMLNSYRWKMNKTIKRDWWDIHIFLVRRWLEGGRKIRTSDFSLS